MANPWGTPSAGGARACAVGWGLTGAVCLSLCPHRWRPHRLLLQLPATPRPAGPHHLRLHHQQQLHPARGDVSTHCYGGLRVRWLGQRVAGRGMGTRPGTPRALPAGPSAGTPLPRPSAPTQVLSQQPGHQEEEGAVRGPPGALGAGASEALPDPEELTLPRCHPTMPLVLPPAGLASSPRHAREYLNCSLLQRENLFYLTYLS